MASIKDEPWQTNYISDLNAIIAALKAIKPCPDILTFSQRLPDTQPRYGVYFEYDKVAAISILTFENWLKRRIKPNAR